MYKKVKKSVQYPYGIDKFASININRPFIYFSVPFGNDRGINGYLKRLLYLLRIRDGENINSGLEIDSVPFNLYCSSKINLDDFLPLLDLIDKNNFDMALKILRNINFVSYCDGNQKLLNVILKIHDYLKNKGFKENEIEKLMSQISVLQIVDNLNYNNDTFPYVTTNTLHIRQDDANPEWLNDKSKSKEGQFSKSVIKEVSNNKRVIIIDSFGEGALKFGEDHIFSKHYLSFPVINSLMSICLILSIESSLKNKEISLDYYQKGIDYILTKAHEYEIKYSKDLNTMSKEDIIEFSNYMMDIITDYLKNEFNIQDIDRNSINKALKEEKILKDNAGDLSRDYIGSIESDIKRILKYKDKDLDDMDKMLLGNHEIDYKIKDIIVVYYRNLMKNVKDTINIITNITISDEELNAQLVSWKKNKIKQIQNLINDKNLTELLKKCDIEVIEELVIA